MDLIWAINLPCNSLHREWTLSKDLISWLVINTTCCWLWRDLSGFHLPSNLVFNQVWKHPGQGNSYSMCERSCLVCMRPPSLNLDWCWCKSWLGPQRFITPKFIGSTWNIWRRGFDHKTQDQKGNKKSYSGLWFAVRSKCNEFDRAADKGVNLNILLCNIQ